MKKIFKSIVTAVCLGAISASLFACSFQPMTAYEIAVKNGFSPEHGARQLQRYIRSVAEDPISEMMLSGKIGFGDKIVAEKDEYGKTIFKKEESVMA